MGPGFRRLSRHFVATFFDTSLEFLGGLLGSYFGAMLAALVTAMNQEAGAQAMQDSMRSGFGFGFAFWALSISFINRVLIQGISRASIGKKMMGLEVSSTGAALTWGRMALRWVLSIGSLSAFGAGYWYAFFNREGKFFHDLLAGTNVHREHASASIDPKSLPMVRVSAVPMVRVAPALPVVAETPAEAAVEEKKKAA